MLNEKFEIMLNCEDPVKIKATFEKYPILAGVTTNPVMISRLKRTDYFQILKEIRAIIGNKKLFTQVTSKNTADIITEAEMIRRAGGENTIVKVPAFDFGIEAIYELNKRHIRTCGTLCCSTIQGVFALEAGASYVVPFHFHMKDAGLDPVSVTGELVNFVKKTGKGKVMGAAQRTLEEFGYAIGQGVDACTIDPDFIESGMANACAVKNLGDFLGGWATVFGDKCIKDLSE